jgi:hypothetical protein
MTKHPELLFGDYRHPYKPEHKRVWKTKPKPRAIPIKQSFLQSIWKKIINLTKRN